MIIICLKPEEILWGHQFSSCVHYLSKEAVYAVDLARLSAVTADNTPRQARQYHKLVKFYFTVQICTCIYRCILACTCILANRFRVNKAKSYSERVAYCSYIVHNKTSIQQTDSSFRNLLLLF